ncbi:hypothetical protein QTP88_022317 [Uroleucon formosanum]
MLLRLILFLIKIVQKQFMPAKINLDRILRKILFTSIRYLFPIKSITERSSNKYIGTLLCKVGVIIVYKIMNVYIFYQKFRLDHSCSARSKLMVGTFSLIKGNKWVDTFRPLIIYFLCAWVYLSVGLPLKWLMPCTRTVYIYLNTSYRLTVLVDLVHFIYVLRISIGKGECTLKKLTLPAKCSSNQYSYWNFVTLHTPHGLL